MIKKKKSTLLHLLRRSREARQLNVRDLAKKVGISRSAISEYERGKFAPRYEIWIRLKEILNLPGEFSDYWKSEFSGRHGPNGKIITCSEKDCSCPVLAKGLCSKHYHRNHRQRIAREKKKKKI